MLTVSSRSNEFAFITSLWVALVNIYRKRLQNLKCSFIHKYLVQTDRELVLDAAIHEKLLIVSSRYNELVFVTSPWVALVNIY